MTFDSLRPLLEKAIASRQPLPDPHHQAALRLFNGFSEGYPDFTLDVYGRTLLVHNYADDPAKNQAILREAAAFTQALLQWLEAVIVKTRSGQTQTEKHGVLISGDNADTKIREHGVWYSVDLTMSRDAGFYLDTRNLRKWLIDNMRGKTILNTFAYTGSLGVAATAGEAARVVQQDLNKRFLDVAKSSHTLNGFAIQKRDFIAQDFFPTIARFKSMKQYFDCVILDPPFFSSTSKGRVDLANESKRLINKVRPLINDGGVLVAVNNALFLSGAAFMQTLEELCKDGYLKIREFIPVPADCVGINRIGAPITDPAPFNHSTKIAILDVKRKKI